MNKLEKGSVQQKNVQKTIFSKIKLRDSRVGVTVKVVQIMWQKPNPSGNMTGGVFL
jgi:hypothetical protein